MPKFRCVVAIPTKELYSGEVDYAGIPGVDGDYGVLSGHESFVGLNRTGVLTLWFDPEGKEKAQFLIMGGATQVLNSHLSVLPRFGCSVDEIDADQVKDEMEALKAQIAEIEREGGDAGESVSRTLVSESLAWCEAQLKAVGQ